MTWNFDLTHMPKEPGTRLWLAHPTDGKVYLTYRAQPTKQHPTGWWSGWKPGLEPVAWMPFAKPEHPFAGKDEARTELAGIMATVSGADFLPMIDDCGSGA